MTFDPVVANNLGTDAAIILSNLEFWQEANKANKRNFREGRYWTYNSVSAFEELFPYLSASKIKTCIKKLKDAGYIVAGSFNKHSYDKTKWYSVNSPIHWLKLANGKSELANGVAKTSQPIPNDKQQIVNTNKKTHIVNTNSKQKIFQIFENEGVEATVKFLKFILSDGGSGELNNLPTEVQNAVMRDKDFTIYPTFTATAKEK